MSKKTTTTMKWKIHYYAWAESKPEYAEKQMRCDHSVTEIWMHWKSVFKHMIAYSRNPFQGSMTSNYQTL